MSILSIKPQTSVVRLNAIAETEIDFEYVDEAPLAPADTLAAQNSATLSPSRITKLKQAIFAIAAANTERTDNIAEVRQSMEPMIEELSRHFAANRPTNEVELTRGVWRNVWYDNPDIDRGPFFLKLKRNSILQVVEEGYYYNVSDSQVKALGLKVGTIHSFLRGNYEIIRKPSPSNAGQQRLNTIALEFDELRFKFGKRPLNEDPRQQVADIVDRKTFSLPSPGPRGVKGELWNLYVDEDVRIAAGFQADKPDELQLYVLKRD